MTVHLQVVQYPFSKYDLFIPCNVFIRGHAESEIGRNQSVLVNIIFSYRATYFFLVWIKNEPYSIRHNFTLNLILIQLCLRRIMHALSCAHFCPTLIDPQFVFRTDRHSASISYNHPQILSAVVRPQVTATGQRSLSCFTPKRLASFSPLVL